MLASLQDRPLFMKFVRFLSLINPIVLLLFPADDLGAKKRRRGRQCSNLWLSW